MNGLFQKRPINPEYYFKRGKECFDRGDYHWALESFSSAIEFFPDFKIAYYMRAEVYKKLGKTKDAVWDFIKFLETNSSSSGTTSDVLGPLKTAKKGMDIARIETPDFIGPLEIVKGAVDSAIYQSKRTKIQEEIISFGIPTLLEEIIEGYSPQEKYIDTYFYYLALRWLEKNSPDRKYYTGFVYLLLNDLDKAIEMLDEVIIENPANPKAYYFRGVAFTKKIEQTENMEASSRHLEKAYSDFSQALKNGFKWRICPRCGYRTDSITSYCMFCGRKLLVE